MLWKGFFDFEIPKTVKKGLSIGNSDKKRGQILVVSCQCQHPLLDPARRWPSGSIFQNIKIIKILISVIKPYDSRIENYLAFESTISKNY